MKIVLTAVRRAVAGYETDNTEKSNQMGSKAKDTLASFSLVSSLTEADHTGWGKLMEADDK